jgi:hypothetical protein
MFPGGCLNCTKAAQNAKIDLRVLDVRTNYQIHTIKNRYDQCIQHQGAAMRNDKQTTWEKYASAWIEVTATGKADARRQSVAATCVYKDPATISTGHDELVACMLAFRQQMPGGYFVTT